MKRLLVLGGGTAGTMVVNKLRPKLPKDEWHCFEISYDGAARVQQLYVNDALQIDAQGYPEGANAFTTFKFGYNSLHGTTRNTWYDDVAVAPGRIGCF